MRALKLDIGSVTDWSAVTDGIEVSDQIDLERFPETKTTVGFARLEAGEEMEITFPYDEVLVITKGEYVVDTGDGEIRAQAGEVIFLPADSSNGSRAERDTEMVYVAAPPDTYAAHVAASSG